MHVPGNPDAAPLAMIRAAIIPLLVAAFYFQLHRRKRPGEEKGERPQSGSPGREKGEDPFQGLLRKFRVPRRLRGKPPAKR